MGESIADVNVGAWGRAYPMFPRKHGSFPRAGVLWFNTHIAKSPT